MKKELGSRVRLSAALAALWLSACGGGGDGMQGAPAPMASAEPSLLAPMRAAAAGSSWAQAFPSPQIWHWVSMNTTGDVIVAGEAPTGRVRVSADGGASWTAGNSTAGIWISSDLSASGDRIVALQYGGGMFMSTDRGSNWTQVTSSPLVYAPDGIRFEAVSLSQDGQRMALVIQDGPIVLSHDAGATWTAATLPDGPSNRWWRWVDSSADGSVIVAVSHNGEVYRSSDAGATWAAVTVAVGAPAAPVIEHWYRVKLSADGNTIAMAANSHGGGPGTGIYVSHDRGATWTRGFSLTVDYTAIAMSADGQTIGATISNTGGTPGRVLLSLDGGASFNPVAMPGTDTNWRAFAMSADAGKMAVAAGAFDSGTAGLLYTSGASSAPAPSPAPAPAPTPAPAPAPSCAAPAWSSTTHYLAGDRVTRSGNLYVATAQSSTTWNENSPPEWSPSLWSLTACSSPAPSPAPAPAPTPTPAPTPAPAPCSAPVWNGSTRYLPGDRVLRNSVLYVATQQSATSWNQNSPPEWTPSLWSVASCS